MEKISATFVWARKVPDAIIMPGSHSQHCKVIECVGEGYSDEKIFTIACECQRRRFLLELWEGGFFDVLRS